MIVAGLMNEAMKIEIELTARQANPSDLKENP
jgi:hypothetical protein